MAAESEEVDDVLPTVPWPSLNKDALEGVPGEIVTEVASYTEADSAAMLLQLHAVFGACVGPNPHIVWATPITTR